MNSEYVRCDDIIIIHNSDSENNTPIKIIAPSGIGIDRPIHLKEFFIDDKFKMIVESNSLVIQKKIDGIFTNYFKLE